ncbi:MAG: PEGA domain-containing protein, partial [Nannocystaceae bacterium]
ETSAAVLRRKLDALDLGPTKLEVRTEPAGAVVRVDGEIVGTTPLERTLPSGKHRVRVESMGYISLEKEIVFVEGATETVDLTLEPLPSVLPPARWGWGALSVGLVALGGGAALAWLDRKPQNFRCSEEDGSKDADGDCEFLWNTKWFAAGSFVAGSALVTLGAVILLESRLRSRPKQEAWRSSPRRPRVMVGPRGVTLTGRF